MKSVRPLPHPQGVQSVEVGLALFQHLAQQPGPCSLSDLARQAGMHRAKAYRYLVSLVRLGWVRQDARSSLYEIGPAVQDLALSWLLQRDPVRLAAREARVLAHDSGCTCFVAMWGQRGATAAQVYQPDRAVALSIVQGAVLDARTSATGRVFSVWREAPAGFPAAQQQAIRAQGVAVVQGDHVAGINAISAPVFDAEGQLALALTLVAPAAILTADASGAAAQALRQASARVSAGLGHMPSVSPPETSLRS